MSIVVVVVFVGQKKKKHDFHRFSKDHFFVLLLFVNPAKSQQWQEMKKKMARMTAFPRVNRAYITSTLKRRGRKKKKCRKGCMARKFLIVFCCFCVSTTIMIVCSINDMLYKLLKIVSGGIYYDSEDEKREKELKKKRYDGKNQHKHFRLFCLSGLADDGVFCFFSLTLLLFLFTSFSIGARI